MGQHFPHLTELRSGEQQDDGDQYTVGGRETAGKLQAVFQYQHAAQTGSQERHSYRAAKHEPKVIELTRLLRLEMSQYDQRVPDQLHSQHLREDVSGELETEAEKNHRPGKAHRLSEIELRPDAVSESGGQCGYAQKVKRTCVSEEAD